MTEPSPYELKLAEIKSSFRALLRHEIARAICEERTWMGAWERANEVERQHWLADADAALDILSKRTEVMIATVDLTYLGGAAASSRGFLRRSLDTLFSGGGA